MENHSTYYPFYPILVVCSVFAYAMGMLFGGLITKNVDEYSHVCYCEEP